MNRRAMIVPIVVAVSLGFSACGDDDDKELSKSDLAKKANAICKDSSDESEGITQPADLQTNPVAAASYFGKVAPISQKQTEKFEDLKPDDDAKADWNQLVARQKQGNDVIKVILSKAKAKDQSGLQDLAKLQRIDAKFRTEATAVGADDCAT